MDERTMGTYHIPAQHQGQRRNDSIIHQQAARWWPGARGTPRRIWHERRKRLEGQQGSLTSQGDTKENLAREKEGGEKA